MPLNWSGWSGSRFRRESCRSTGSLMPRFSPGQAGSGSRFRRESYRSTRLLPRSSPVRLVRFPISAGIVPLNSLMPRLSGWSGGSGFPISAGIVPLNRLWLRSKRVTRPSLLLILTPEPLPERLVGLPVVVAGPVCAVGGVVRVLRGRRVRPPDPSAAAYPLRRGGLLPLRTGTSSRSPEPDRVRCRYRQSGGAGSGSRVRRESCRSTGCL